MATTGLKFERFNEFFNRSTGQLISGRLIVLAEITQPTLELNGITYVRSTRQAIAGRTTYFAGRKPDEVGTINVTEPTTA